MRDHFVVSETTTSMSGPSKGSTGATPADQVPANKPHWARRLSQRFSTSSSSNGGSPAPPLPALGTHVAAGSFDTTTATADDVRRPLPSGDRPVWLDCDPGHDDAIALLMALFAPSYDSASCPSKFDSKAKQAAMTLLGVSAVGGNAPVTATFANAARLLEFFGAPVPSSPDDVQGQGVHLFMGAADPLVKKQRCDPDIHGEDGLGGVTGLPPLRSAAVQKRVWASYGRLGAADGEHSGPLVPRASPSALLNHWYRLLQYRIAHSLPKVTIVATGPLTNVALLIKACPELVEDGVEEIVIMGGVEGQRGNRGPLAEFNILVDPEAASIVFNHNIKVVMAGLNVTHQAIFTPSLLEKLLTLKSSAPRSRAHSGVQPSDASPSSPVPSDIPLQTTLEATQDFRKTISSILTFFAQTYASEFGFTEGPPVHDVLAVAYVVDPTLFWKNDRTTPPARYNVQVECNENSLALGATVADVYAKDNNAHPHSYWGRGGRNVEVLDYVDVDRLWQLFFTCIERAEKHKLGFSSGVISPAAKTQGLPSMDQ